MSFRVLMSATNNGVVDYQKFAILNALLIKRLDPTIEIAIISAETDWAPTSLFSERYVDLSNNTHANRTYLGEDKVHSGPFLNKVRTEFHRYGTARRNVMIDVDYLIFDLRQFDLLREIQIPYSVMINRETRSIYGPRNRTFHSLCPEGIPQRWATVFAFEHGEEARQFSEVVGKVADNYEYYGNLFGFSTRMFRNDFVFSVAAHIMNGFRNNSPIVGDLPIPHLLFAWDTDPVIGYHETGLVFFSQIPGNKKLPVRTENQNVHVLNKMSLHTRIDEMIKYYENN